LAATVSPWQEGDAVRFTPTFAVGAKQRARSMDRATSKEYQRPDTDLTISTGQFR
jgi:hypothetical protein